jgi:hypothetical protein
MNRAIALILCAACSKSGEPKLGNQPAPTPPAPAAKLAACPVDKDLNARVAPLLGVAVENIDSATCTAGRFPEPMWLITARYSKDPDDMMVYERELVLDPAGKVLSQGEELDMPMGAAMASGTSDATAADLDGDGIDELVEVSFYDRHGYQSQTLHVRRRVGQGPSATWEPMLERQFAYDNSAADEPPILTCDASWKITPPGADGKRSIVFEPTQAPDTPSESCIVSKETWVLGAGGKLVKSK